MGERLQWETAFSETVFTVSRVETANTVSPSETANTVLPAETANAVSRALFIQRVINTPRRPFSQGAGAERSKADHFEQSRAEVLILRPILDNQALTWFQEERLSYIDKISFQFLTSINEVRIINPSRFNQNLWLGGPRVKALPAQAKIPRKQWSKQRSCVYFLKSCNFLFVV